MHVAKGECKKADPSKFKRVQEENARRVQAGKKAEVPRGSLKWRQEEFADATLGNLWPGFCFDCNPSYKKLNKEELPTTTHLEKTMTKDGDENHSKVEDHFNPLTPSNAHGNAEPGVDVALKVPAAAEEAEQM